MKTAAILLQTLFLIALAPLVSGCIKKVKNTVRMRRGASVFQPYYNLRKLFAKEEVVSATASWIFIAAPYIVLASSVAALLLLPSAVAGRALRTPGELLALIFILALGRFFLALAGLDAGSAFGGMGSSREMFISSFAEPVALLALFAAGLARGSTDAVALAAARSPSVAAFTAGASLFLVMLAETSRIPVDNQETHLELTMVHEAMALEYSGRGLALIELAAHVKQIVFFSLIALIVLPPGMLPGAGAAGAVAGAARYLLALSGIGLAVAVCEVSMAKMRLFRVADFLAFAYVLAGLAVVTAVIGL